MCLQGDKRQLRNVASPGADIIDIIQCSWPDREDLIHQDCSMLLIKQYCEECWYFTKYEWDKHFLLKPNSSLIEITDSTLGTNSILTNTIVNTINYPV